MFHGTKFVTHIHFDFAQLQLGQVDHVPVGEGDTDNREKLIKQHFTNRITELSTQFQVADSKALHFHAEVGECMYMYTMYTGESEQGV